VAPLEAMTESLVRRARLGFLIAVGAILDDPAFGPRPRRSPRRAATHPAEKDAAPVDPGPRRSTWG